MVVLVGPAITTSLIPVDVGEIVILNCHVHTALSLIHLYSGAILTKKTINVCGWRGSVRCTIFDANEVN